MEAGVSDIGEITKPDSPEQDSDSDVSTTGEPSNAAPFAPAQPPTELLPLHEWGVLKLKNLNALPAKLGFDSKEWPGDELGAQRIFRAMAEAFSWDTTDFNWFLNSENILWTFSKSSKPTGAGRYYHEHITGKTKVVGMLPFKLFPDFQRMEAHHQSKALLFGKTLFTPAEARSTSYSGNAPKGFDWSKKVILLEIVSQGTAHAALLAFNKNKKSVYFFLGQLRLLIGKAV